MHHVLFFALNFLLLVSSIVSQTNNETASHITGSLRIKRSCISDPLLHCIYNSDVSSTNHCPHSVNNWSDVHCVNNSFGLYTPQSQFMELGSGPLGINLNDGYFQYVSYIPAAKNHHKDEMESQKIEHLIEEKAKMEMKASFFESRFHEVEVSNEELRDKLQQAEERYNAAALQINSLTIRLNRWEQGTAACKENMEGEQKKTSAALEICNKHIAQLEEENAVYMDTNRELSETVSKLRHSCDGARTSSAQCNAHLSECNAQVSLCQESEHSLELALTEQSESHKAYMHRAENEYTNLHNILQSVREDLAECSTSLDNSRDRNDGLQQSRDLYISRLSKETTLLKQCQDDLSRCHSNHSISTSLHSECRTEIDEFTNRINLIQEQYMRCTSDLNEIRFELQAQVNKNKELLETQNDQISQLEMLNHQTENDEKRISELTNMYTTEKAHYQEARGDLHSCQTDLRALTELGNTQKSEISQLKQVNVELTLFKTECIERRESLAKEVAVHLSTISNLKTRYSVCESQLSKYQTENERLISMTTSLQGELTALKKVHAILVGQNADCMVKHNISIQTVDDWKDQFMECNEENRNLSTSFFACQTRNEFLNNMLTSLEQEAEVSLRTQENLASRLQKSTTIISDLTKTIAESDGRTNHLEEEIARINAILEQKENVYRTTSQQYTECSSNYSISQQTIITLQQNAQFNTELLDALKKQAKETSDQLVHAQASLSHYQSLLEQETNKVIGLQTRLRAAHELYENEHQMRAALEIQLQLCHANNTEAGSTTGTLEARLEQCGQRVTELIEAHEQEMQDIEARLSAMTVARDTANEAHGQLNASLHYCEEQQALLQSEKETLQHQVGEYAQSLHIHITRAEYILNLKVSLEKRLESCILETKQCQSLQQIQNYKLEQCNERVLGANADLELVRTQLKHCNENCKQTSLVCPESHTGEAYVLTGSGCLLQTAMSGSENDLELYCQGVNGHLLQLPANDQHFNKDVIEMLNFSGKQATTVWISRPDQPEENCYSVDILRMKDDLTTPVEYMKTSCGTTLPGICFASLQGDSLAMGSSSSDYGSLFSDLGGLSSFDSTMNDYNTIQAYGDYDLQLSSSSSLSGTSSSSSSYSVITG